MSTKETLLLLQLQRKIKEAKQKFNFDAGLKDLGIYHPTKETKVEVALICSVSRRNPR